MQSEKEPVSHNEIKQPDGSETVSENSDGPENDARPAATPKDNSSEKSVQSKNSIRKETATGTKRAKVQAVKK